MEELLQRAKSITIFSLGHENLTRAPCMALLGLGDLGTTHSATLQDAVSPNSVLGLAHDATQDCSNLRYREDENARNQ